MVNTCFVHPQPLPPLMPPHTYTRTHIHTAQTCHTHTHAHTCTPPPPPACTPPQLFEDLDEGYVVSGVSTCTARNAAELRAVFNTGRSNRDLQVGGRGQGWVCRRMYGWGGCVCMRGSPPGG